LISIEFGESGNMTGCTKLFGYSLVVVILIIAVIGILGMIGAQKIFNTTIEDAQEQDVYVTGNMKIVEVYDNAPLARAVREANTNFVKILLAGGADPDIRTSTGGTPLHRAAAKGLVDIARLFLEYEADVNALNSKSITPLHLAAGNGHFEMVQLLIDYDANISPKNDDGQTPLAMALQGLAATEPTNADARRRYEKAIDLLRSWGAK
jgi:hypothetical protein